MIQSFVRNCSIGFASHHITVSNMQRIIHAYITDAVLPESSQANGPTDADRVKHLILCQASMNAMIHAGSIRTDSVVRFVMSVRERTKSGGHRQLMMKLADVDHM